MKKIIAPSLLSCDFANLQNEIEMLNQSKAEWLHLDVMDGVFVPNITFGPPVLRYIKKHTKKVLDVHLMIVQPERHITNFKEAGADVLTVHYEACTHLHRTVQQIKVEGMQAGVSLNPHTPVAVLEDILAELDLVLLMSVNPGFGGQRFIKNTYKKVRQLKQMLHNTASKVSIEVDGGVSNTNIKDLSDAGVDVFVSGSSIFESDSPMETISELEKLVNG